MYVTASLEFSEDALTVSNAAASYVDVTSYLLEARWSAGVEKEGDPPRPGQASFVLDDRLRNFEPDYTAGSFYPNIVPERRFRWKVNSDSVTYSQGVWYAAAWQPDWPDRLMMQETTVTCADGFLPLALDNLPGLDPPTAETYADVVAHDRPSAHYAMDDPPGTRMRARVIGKGKHRRRVRRRVIATELGEIAGPAGVYFGLPTLGGPGLILGDPGTAVTFTSTSQFARALVADSDTWGTAGELAIEAWFRPSHTTVDRTIARMPRDSFGDAIGSLGIAAGGNYSVIFSGKQVTATTAPVVGELVHLVGTGTAGRVRIYVNGVLENEESQPNPLNVPVANEHVVIGSSSGSGTARGTYAHVVFYEKELTLERILAHYQAGTARGFAQETSGERVQDIATSSLWAETGIQTTGRDVLPVMEYGQPRVDEISETMRVEGPRSMFFFDGDGDPVFLGHDWQATTASYSAVQATFGNDTGEVPFEDIDLVYDDEFYRTVRANRENGDKVTATTGVTPDRVTEEPDLLLTDDTDVEALANNILDLYTAPAFRPVTLELNGDDEDAREQILARDIGDLVRVKHRPRGGTAIDRVCNIIGYEKALERETGKLTGTFRLSRGFNASLGLWQLGITGFSELNTTAELA